MTAAPLSEQRDLPPLVENGTRAPGFFTRLGDVWAYRELLSNLVRRELKVRYKNSVIGLMWTLLNPLLYLAVFSVVFGMVLPSGAPRYGLLLLSGLLAFNLFSQSLTSSAVSVTSNGPLVQKVWFPREILPLASIGASLVTFFFQLTILLIGLAAFRQVPEWGMVWLVIPALMVTLLMAAGLGLLMSALNVYYRDVQHFLELGLLTWFWFTPVVYRYNFAGEAVIDRLGPGAERLLMLNPMIPVVAVFQRVIYNPTNFGSEDQALFSLLLRPSSWYLQNLAISAGFGLVFLYVGFKVFTRLEADLGEEL